MQPCSRTCSSRSSSILRGFNRQGARAKSTRPAGVAATSWMALPAVLMGSAAALGAIIALLTATYLFDDLDPLVPILSLPLQACSDGIDNDRDGKTDAKDPGCSSPTNPAEKNLACSDDVDKDRDGRTDFTRIRLLVAQRPLREVASEGTGFGCRGRRKAT